MIFESSDVLSRRVEVREAMSAQGGMRARPHAQIWFVPPIGKVVAALPSFHSPVGYLVMQIADSAEFVLGHFVHIRCKIRIWGGQSSRSDGALHRSPAF